MVCPTILVLYLLCLAQPAVISHPEYMLYPIESELGKTTVILKRSKETIVPETLNVIRSTHRYFPQHLGTRTVVTSYCSEISVSTRFLHQPCNAGFLRIIKWVS